MLIANSNLVGHWSNCEQFNELERLGLTMYGQMTAGSWIYIGSQGIVQGTFETFARSGRKTFRRRSRRQTHCQRWHWWNGRRAAVGCDDEWRVLLGVEVDPVRIEKRLATGYCDHMAKSLDQALQLVDEARKAKRAVSVGLVGNCADVLPEMVQRKFRSRFAD